MTPDRRRDVAWLLVAALAVRLVALVVARAGGRFPEFWEYETIARRLLAGDGFVYRFMGIPHFAYVEPVYPWFVAAVYLVAGFHPTVVAVLQCAIAAALAPVVYAFARRTFDRRSAIAAGVLVALHPALAGYAVKLHPLSFDTLAIVVVALMLLDLLAAPDRRRTLAFGLAAGACVLMRPTVLVALVAAVVWLAWRRDRRVALPYVVIGLVIAAVVVTPWVVRNHARVDAVVLTRSHVGFNFWLGNHPGATGGEGDPTDPTGSRSLFDRAPTEFRERVLSQPDEISQDRVFWSEALGYVAREPVAFVARTVRKLVDFWWFAAYLGRRYATVEVIVYGLFYLGVAGLAMIGLLSSWRRPVPGQGDGIRIVLLIVVSMAVAQSLFYVQGRHRLAVEPLLIVLSGHGLATLIAYARRT